MLIAKVVAEGPVLAAIPFLDWFNTILGVVGITLALWIYYGDVSRKLDTLLSQKQSNLTYSQASDLLALYLAATQKELQISTRDFFRYRIPNLKAMEEATRLVFSDFDEIIKSNRTRLCRFNLPGNVTFQTFLERSNPRESGIIGAAKHDVHQVFDANLHHRITVEEAREKVLNIMEKAYRSSNELLEIRLKELYSSKD